MTTTQSLFETLPSRLRTLSLHCLIAGEMSFNWVSTPKTLNEATQAPEDTGKVDLLKYEHYDDASNGELQEVVPGKFVAFKGGIMTTTAGIATSVPCTILTSPTTSVADVICVNEP